MKKILFLYFIIFCSALYSQVTVQGTLQECTASLSSDRPLEERRRAALIVGKYPGRQVSEILLRCLRDADCEVRRNALVSIGENRFHERYCAAGGLQCLMDEDVTMRRLASSMLGRILMVLMNEDRQLASSSSLAHQRLIAVLCHALQDSDRAVRQNTLIALQHSRSIVLPPLLYVSFIDDPVSSPEIVILAIQGLLRGKYKDFDCAPVIRKALRRCSTVEQCTQILKYGSYLPKAQLASIVEEQLRNASDNSMKLMLLNTLVECQNGQVDDKYRSLMQELVQDEQLSVTSRSYLLGGVLRQSPELIDGYRLDVSQPPEFRLIAWRCYLMQNANAKQISLNMWIELCMKETYPPLRREFLHILSARKSEMRSDDLLLMQQCMYADVRKCALDLSQIMPMQQRIEFLRNALPDEDAEIRRYAVVILSRLRPQGWQEDMMAALEDDNDVAEMAAVALLSVANVDTSVRRALEEYFPRCTNNVLKSRIRRLLRMKN